MHQSQFRLRIRPDLAGGAYSAPPDPLAGIKWTPFKGRRRVQEEEGEEREGTGGEGKEGVGDPQLYL